MESISALFETAIQRHRDGRLDLAEEIYRRILHSDPDHADALHLLGVIANQVGNHEASIGYIRQAIELNENSAIAHSNLGIALHDLQRIPEAIVCYRRVLELNPNDVQTHLNLGVALKSLGSPDEAVACYRQALRLHPDCVEAHNNLGIEWHDQGFLNESIDCFRRALELKPESSEIHNNLGNVFKDLGKLDEAGTCFNQAIQLKPNYSAAHNNQGNALKEQGRLTAAIDSYRRAIEFNPNFVIAHSNLVYTQLFRPDNDEAALLEEHRHWEQMHATPLAKLIQPHLNVRSSDRRLRIGYVSPDFRDHCQAFFTVPLMSFHDHAQVEIVCYADVARPDLITDRLRQLADIWRNIAGLDDEQVANMIRQDRIDILVDLTMHMSHNRLLTFARKPAPVQVCWLAYPGTTGLTTMDYRFTDPFLDPPNQHLECYSEKSIRLADTFWCYDPLESETVVTRLPAEVNGYVTFGCFNNFCKVNATVVKLWAQVLKAVRRSRIVILAGEGTHRQYVLDEFSTEGIASDRVSFVTYEPRPQYLRNYHQIDIGLDTVPYNGHTTSLDSFWMGVPVVTLVGRTVVGRAGVCQLMNLGLPELIAATPEQFVDIAATLAHDLPRLSDLRATLRERMKASPLMDAKRFARNIESAYRTIWRQWCDGRNC